MSKLVVSLADIDERFLQENRVICLFSGGLDGTYLLHHIASVLPSARVLALTIELGGGDGVRAERVCRELGIEHEVLNLTREFLADYAFPAIAAQAVYLGTHPISASLTRPLMAQAAAAVAREREYDAVLHTADGTQNSLRRFNQTFAALKFAGSYGSPFVVDAPSREKKLLKLADAGLAGVVVRARPESVLYSTDVNLWCREFEAAGLDDPEQIDVPDSLYEWTVPTDPQPIVVEVGFERGVPVALDGRPCEPDVLVRELNACVGARGIGRYIGLEEIASGRKVQEVREMPAAHLLLDAYRRLEQSSVNAATMREKVHLEQVWVHEAVEGRWLGPLREAAQAFISSVAQAVSGRVRYKVSAAGLTPRAVIAQEPLYVRDRVEIPEP
jgi:argininosuccinate synthase